MTENALSILIIIFSIQLQQTETSDRKLFIFKHGCLVVLDPHSHRPQLFLMTVIDRLTVNIKIKKILNTGIEFKNEKVYVGYQLCSLWMIES